MVTEFDVLRPDGTVGHTTHLTLSNDHSNQPSYESRLLSVGFNAMFADEEAWLPVGQHVLGALQLTR